MKFTFHDELFFLHFASLCYVVLKLCELFMVFKYMLLILMSHSFDCKE